MIAFNKYNMIGMTDLDNLNLLENSHKDLLVDERGWVFTKDTNEFVAKVMDTLPGEGFHKVNLNADTTEALDVLSNLTRREFNPLEREGMTEKDEQAIYSEIDKNLEVILYVDILGFVWTRPEGGEFICKTKVKGW